MPKEAPVNKHTPSNTRTVSLFRNGRNQAIRIPVEFELPGDEVTIRKEGDRLIIEAKVPKDDLLTYLRSLPPMGPEDEFPDIDDYLPLRDVDL
jgi:antitoxin VapB